jgi:hypothetical protein
MTYDVVAPAGGSTPVDVKPGRPCSRAGTRRRPTNWVVSARAVQREVSWSASVRETRPAVMARSRIDCFTDRQLSQPSRPARDGFVRVVIVDLSQHARDVLPVASACRSSPARIAVAYLPEVARAAEHSVERHRAIPIHIVHESIQPGLAAGTRGDTGPRWR